MERTINGFKQRGGWRDIVEHGERITAALKHESIPDDYFTEWDDWRPKPDERMDTDINEKTVEKATVDEGPGEQTNTPANTDLTKAGKKLSETGARDSPKDAAKDMQESISYAKRALDTISRKILRPVEEFVYKHVMTVLSPYYFDNEYVSATLSRRTNRKTNTPRYTLEVNINDDDIRDSLAETLDDFEAIDRWHGETPKETSTVEAIEGKHNGLDDNPVENSLAQLD